jgi:hypothetical protein
MGFASGYNLSRLGEDLMGSICNPLTTDDVASKYVGTFVTRVTDDRCTRQPTEPREGFYRPRNK